MKCREGKGGGGFPQGQDGQAGPKFTGEAVFCHFNEYKNFTKVLSLIQFTPGPIWSIGGLYKWGIVHMYVYS